MQSGRSMNVVDPVPITDHIKLITGRRSRQMGAFGAIANSHENLRRPSEISDRGPLEMTFSDEHPSNK